MASGKRGGPALTSLALTLLLGAAGIPGSWSLGVGPKMFFLAPSFTSNGSANFSQNRCLDANNGGQIHPFNCDANNNNHLFSWIWADAAQTWGQIQLVGSAFRLGTAKCVDDGGWNSTTGMNNTFLMRDCQTSSQNQFFKFPKAPLYTLESYYKPGSCAAATVDYTSDTSNYWLDDCTKANATMQSGASMVIPMRDAGFNPNELLQAGFQTFQIKLPRATGNFCMNASTGGSGQAVCNGSSAGQQFVFWWPDAGLFAGLIQLNGTNLCLDGGSGLYLHTCDITNTWHIWFMDKTTGYIRLWWTRQGNNCLQLNSGSGSLQPCNANQANQSFSIQPVGTLKPFTNYQPQTGLKFKVQNIAKGFCFDVNFQYTSCTSASLLRVSVITPETGVSPVQLQQAGTTGSSNGSTMYCVDDNNAWGTFRNAFGGGAGFNSGNETNSQLRLAPCDSSSPNQLWYNKGDGHIASYIKNSLCVDDQGSNTTCSGTTAYSFLCATFKIDQLFTLVPW